MSPSSSGVSSLGSSWNSPAPLTPPGFSSSSLAASDSPVSALLELSGDYGLEKQHSDSDEGIVSDQSCEFEQKRKKVSNFFPLFYPCRERTMALKSMFNPFFYSFLISSVRKNFKSFP